MSEPDASGYDFTTIPQWPHFAITNDEVSSRVPVTKVESWRSLSTILEDPFFSQRGNKLIYRGQQRFDWSLSPTLGRLDPRHIVTKEAADTQIALFRRAVRGRLNDHDLVVPEEEYELWAVGQHYGLKTPLLDWSHSPYVALFFAFEREDRELESKNPFRAIYILNKTHVEAEDRCPGVSVLEPRKDDHGRLVSQAGLFTYSSYEDSLENALINSLQEEEVLGDIEEGQEATALSRYICKIYIPNAERIECLRHLRLMNVHHASLFPDLIGAAQYCNSLISEEIEYISPKLEPIPTMAAIAETMRMTDTIEAEVVPASEGNTQARLILSALSSIAASTEVERPRLEYISRELATEIEKQQYVDWQKRESVQAAMRNTVRSVLRKLGYPAAAREEALDAIFKELLG
jgi:hypothetical protein